MSRSIEKEFGRFSPRFIAIVGRHNLHWNYSKLGTVRMLGEYIQDIELEASVKAREALDEEIAELAAKIVNREQRRIKQRDNSLPYITVTTNRGGFVHNETIEMIKQTVRNGIEVRIVTPEYER